MGAVLGCKFQPCSRQPMGEKGCRLHMVLARGDTLIILLIDLGSQQPLGVSGDAFL